MTHAQQSGSALSDRHDLVKAVYLWRNGSCHRIEVLRRAVKPGEPTSYVALLWIEEEHGAGHRILVRDVTFPWVHHESTDSALDHVIGFLEAKLTPGAGAESELSA
jgi:hypothetical protein